jgi:hypothetical protein
MGKHHLHGPDVIIRCPDREDEDGFPEGGIFKITTDDRGDRDFLGRDPWLAIVLVDQKEPSVGEVGLEPELLDLDIPGAYPEILSRLEVPGSAGRFLLVQGRIRSAELVDDHGSDPLMYLYVGFWDLYCFRKSPAPHQSLHPSCHEGGAWNDTGMTRYLPRAQVRYPDE